MDLSFLDQASYTPGSRALQVSGISEASIDGAPDMLVMPPGGDVSQGDAPSPLWAAKKQSMGARGRRGGGGGGGGGGV